VLGLCLLCAAQYAAADRAQLKINQIQFVGSHNSYKQAMSPLIYKALHVLDAEVAESLEYWHAPLAEQLNLGLRKLEIDLFYDAKVQTFPVGHAQIIDMNSHCDTLLVCLQEVRVWSEQNPRHMPIWISFNLKDQAIPGLPDPEPFTPAALDALDAQLHGALGAQIIWPADVQGLRWPTLAEARGKVLLILDEGGAKRDWYYKNWQTRPMFTNAPEGHPAAGVMIINDPIKDFARIQRLVKAGYLVRTRADAGTLEARSNDTLRRDRAFASGAQAISTDYYLAATHFGNDYRVAIDGGIRCNPVLLPQPCVVAE
jgi:hypothetical protein